MIAAVEVYNQGSSGQKAILLAAAVAYFGFGKPQSRND
jgi:hypothetical protein